MAVLPVANCMQTHQDDAQRLTAPKVARESSIMSKVSTSTLGPRSDTSEAQRQQDSMDEKADNMIGATADCCQTDLPTPLTASPEPKVAEGPGHCETTATIVDFEAPGHDPEDPMQWSSAKKFSVVLNIALLSAAGQMASSMVAPSAVQIILEFHTSNLILAVLSVSVFLIGMAVGLLLTSGLSEVYGRVPVIHVTNILFVVFASVAAVSQSLGQLIGFRFLQAVAAAAPPAVGGGVIGDMFAPQDRGRATSVYGLGMLMGPMLGPIAGGYITQTLGWRWNCWVIAIVVSRLLHT